MSEIDGLLTGTRGQYVAYFDDGNTLTIFPSPDRVSDLFYLPGPSFAVSEDITRLTGARLQPNLALAIDYVRYNGAYDNQTPFEGVHRVPIGFGLRIDRDGLTSLIRCWPKFSAPIAREWLDNLCSAITDGVPESSGILLSGGMDSTLVAYAARSTITGGLHAFNLYDSRYPESDERECAGHTAKALGLCLETSDLALRRPFRIPHLSKLPSCFSSKLINASHYERLDELAGDCVLLSGQGGDVAFFERPDLAAISFGRQGLFGVIDSLRGVSARLSRSLGAVALEAMRASIALNDPDRVITERLNKQCESGFRSAWLRREEPALSPLEVLGDHGWQKFRTAVVARLLYYKEHVRAGNGAFAVKEFSPLLSQAMVEALSTVPPSLQLTSVKRPAERALLGRVAPSARYSRSKAYATSSMMTALLDARHTLTELFDDGVMTPALRDGRRTVQESFAAVEMGDGRAVPLLAQLAEVEMLYRAHRFQSFGIDRLMPSTG